LVKILKRVKVYDYFKYFFERAEVYGLDISTIMEWILSRNLVNNSSSVPILKFSLSNGYTPTLVDMKNIIIYTHNRDKFR